jgi:hypothetical protein
MKYFLDTEFIEDGTTIDLISIGIVCEDGRELYLGNRECDFSKASQWVKDNVLVPMGFDYSKPNIPMRSIDPDFWLSKNQIAWAVREFCNPCKYGKPEFWAYYADYDWVVFCQLFGTMIQLPDNYPKYCMDIKQWSVQLGDSTLPKQQKGHHNAIENARHNELMWESLKNIVATLREDIASRIYQF